MTSDRHTLTTIHIYHLEMTSREQFRPRHIADTSGLKLRKIDPPDWRWNRRMYREVGGTFHWVDRLVWPDEKWRAYANNDWLTTIILEVDGQPAGYFEIDRREHPSAELAYFGLVPTYIGRGLGAHLLSAAIEEAWKGTTERVWVHTCSLDHRHALRNYQQRGFRIFKTVTKEIEVVELPADCLLREEGSM